MTLEESLAKLKVKIEGSMPTSHVEIMHQATRDLQASGIENNILKVGDRAPDFSLLNHEGTRISSKEILEKGRLIITFYRGVWCPYCNVDLNNLKRYTSQIEDKNATMLSISPQIEKYNKQIVERQRLNFDLLSDAHNEVAEAFGLRWTMVDPLKTLYNNTFKIHLPTYNGDTSWTLPIPARFIVGTDHIIQYAEYSIDYTKRPNPDVLIEALETP